MGVLGLVAWIQVASRLDGVRSLDRTWGTWLACASLATVFSACCAILAGVKAAEARLRALARETQD